jgi:hypothetical protein
MAGVVTIFVVVVALVIGSLRLLILWRRTKSYQLQKILRELKALRHQYLYTIRVTDSGRTSNPQRLERLDRSLAELLERMGVVELDKRPESLDPVWVFIPVLLAAAGLWLFFNYQPASRGTFGEGVGSSLPTNSEILPSRMFAGPQQYPPREFKAYGILAFNSGPTQSDKSRYDMFCDAYTKSLVHYTTVKAPFRQQMVTVWPIDTDDLANQLNIAPLDGVCAKAVPRYGLFAAQTALASARGQKNILTDRGPFLLAWSPGTAVGEPDAVVLISDLSDVINNEQAKQVFTQWALDIHDNSGLWNKGWNEDKLRLIIRLWADKWGSKILATIGTKE